MVLPKVKSLSLLFFVFAVTAAPLPVEARQVLIEWAPLTLQDCSGDALAIEDYDAMEIYISSSPIPASGETCATNSPPDQPPQGITPTPAVPNANQVTVDLPGGFTYYAVARVRAKGLWSNFSLSKTLVVPEAEAPAPVLLRFELN